MKNDHLKKMATDRREEWDFRVPGEHNWKKISQALFGQSRFLGIAPVTFWRAAAIMLFGLSSWLLITRPYPSTSDSQAIQQQEFTDIESYYAGQIMEKAALIKNEGLFADDTFTQDLQKLEAMYNVLAEEMKRRPSEKVRDAMVLNMLVRIDLLNQQIQKLEETRKSRETSTAI